MTPQTPDLAGVLARLDMILERLNALEFQVSGLIQSQTVEAQAFVLHDDRVRVRVRLDLRDHAPRLTFYDSNGGERLQIGLRTDGVPASWVGGREVGWTTPEDRTWVDSR